MRAVFDAQVLYKPRLGCAKYASLVAIAGSVLSFAAPAGNVCFHKNANTCAPSKDSHATRTRMTSELD